MNEYVAPLNNGPIIGGGMASANEVDKMRDLISLLGNPANQEDFGTPPRQVRRQPAINQNQPIRNQPQHTRRLQSNNSYIPAMNEVGLNESTNYDDYMINEYQQGDYDYYQEHQYQQPVQQRQVITEDISFISNKNAKTSVERYLNRGMNLYTDIVQEIISLDESLVALKKDSIELKERHAKCKELKLVEAGQVFAKQFKETGAKIKILELRLKNINDSINDF